MPQLFGRFFLIDFYMCVSGTTGLDYFPDKGERLCATNVWVQDLGAMRGHGNPVAGGVAVTMWWFSAGCVVRVWHRVSVCSYQVLGH